MKTILVILSMMATIVGCGQMPEAAKEKETEPSELASTKPINFEGYLLSAFDISVDGKNYSDSEDFYTQKLDELEAEKTEAGYDGYQMKFEASIGLDDLKQGMRVYIVPSADRGYASETVVDYDGTFKVEFPKDAEDDAVKIRANKRVNVKLTKGKESVYWCYNFYAEEVNAKVSRDSKPVILDSFFTKLTKYKCQEETSGIKIPQKVVPQTSAKTVDLCTEGPGIPVAEAIEHSDVDYFKECTKSTK